jgi:hypothetical protein
MTPWRVLASFSAQENVPDMNQPIQKFVSLLETLSPATEDEVRKLVQQSAPKSCDLDPIPSWLLKECLDELIPIITHMVNESLATSVVPTDMKIALLSPLLKKISLDTEVFKNFRPVSNLSFI